MSNFNGRLQRAAANTSPRTVRPRPTIHPDRLHDYLDWIATEGPAMHPGASGLHLKLAELAVRLRMGEAQDKATQHTLVEDGLIDPPPPWPETF